MPTSSHIQHHPIPTTQAELDAARWDDDGGHTHEPRPGPAATHWLRISAALTQRLPELAEREDVIVTCQPGTRSGAPAAYFPTLNALEIDADLFNPLPPHSIHPEHEGDENRYPAAWGAFIHEAAHSAHSKWSAPTHQRGTPAHEAATLLEESRAERAHLGRRPQDRPYLRASATTIVMDDFNTRAPTDRWQAAHAAALILARRDAGILDPDETQPLTDTLTRILGQDLLNTLSAIWNAAHTCADHDTQTMLDHGHAWCTALGTDPTQPRPRPKPAQKDEGGPSSGGDGESGGPAGELADAVRAALANVAANEAAQHAAQAAVTDRAAARAKARTEQQARNRTAAETAAKVFTPGAAPYTPTDVPRRKTVVSPVTGWRQPTAEEKSAAASLARALRAAAYRERTLTVTASSAPPGRLSMRGALARDAQRAAGATPTAQPWIHTQRRHTPTPPLRVGIAVDVSGSMISAAGPIASAAWILARATALTDPDSRAATIAYRNHLTAITAPGRNPSHVSEFKASGGGHSLAQATEALRHALDLDHPGTGRLLVIASDGDYSPQETACAAETIRALAATGCAILWLAFAPDPTPLPGVTLVQLTHPTQAITAIAKAATTAISKAHPSGN